MLANDECDGPRPALEAIRRCRELLAQTAPSVGALALEADANRGVEPDIRLSLAMLLAMSCDFDGARQEVATADSILQEFDHGGARVRDSALAEAEVAWLCGDPDIAEKILRDAREGLERQRDDAWVATMSARLAELLAEVGREGEALELAGEARRLVVRGDVRTEAAWRRASATAGHTDGEALAYEAIALLEHTDELTEQAKAQLALAEALRRAGRRKDAVEATDRARTLLRAKGNQAMLARI
jgi:tetratricopeptide (TPR) repeat protein